MKTFILNMPNRQDRRQSIEREFADKPSFDVELVTPVEHRIPATSHWLTFVNVAKKAKSEGLPAFLFCEDDHVFTPEFSESVFYSLVDEAQRMEADLLLGGVSWMQSPIQVSDRLFWLNTFNGIQFAVVFSRFYDCITTCSVAGEKIVTEIALSNLSDKIFTCFPPLSEQKEFGYSDVTARNNQKGYVERLFKSTRRHLTILNKVRNFYRQMV